MFIPEQLFILYYNFSKYHKVALVISKQELSLIKRKVFLKWILCFMK